MEADQIWCLHPIHPKSELTKHDPQHNFGHAHIKLHFLCFGWESINVNLYSIFLF